MKAGGADAIFVALSAVIAARRRIKLGAGGSGAAQAVAAEPGPAPGAAASTSSYSSSSIIADLMAVPRWITEDTVGTLGRESKFLQFNILPCPANGPMTPALA